MEATCRLPFLDLLIFYGPISRSASLILGAMVQGRIENGGWMRMTNGTRTVLEYIVHIVLYQNIYTNFSFYPSHKQIYCTKEKQIFS
jgi:hypothetical protein